MLSRQNFETALARIARRWILARRDERASFAVWFALSLMPMVVFTGLGIDYYNGLSYKSRLDAAADAAALAAINAAQQYINDNSLTEVDPQLTEDAIAAGTAQGYKAFAANAGTTELFAPPTPLVSLTRQPPPNTQTFDATVAYSAQTPTHFGSIVGVNTLNIAGTSSASVTIGKYLDFYLLLDVSGSMGIPTTSDGQKLLAEVNPDNIYYTTTYRTGCNFACHFPGFNGFAATRPGADNIPLRVDTVATAVQALLSEANATETLQNQYRIGLFPFIVHAMPVTTDPSTGLAISADISSSGVVGRVVASTPTMSSQLVNYLDQGNYNSPMGSGGTHFENLWGDMRPYLQPVGDGSSPHSTQPFIFLVTDGMDNNQVYTAAGWTGSQPQSPSMSLCASARAAGYTVAVLYIPYVAIAPPNPNFAGDEDDKADNAIAQNASLLQNTCASPGFFFSASTPEGIVDAMQAMFSQALQAARLTN